MKDAQAVTYDSEGHITKVVQGFGKTAIVKKSKYMIKVEEEERIKEEKRKTRKK